jgi:hypothetical protein
MNRPALDGDGGSTPLGEVPSDERLLLGLGDPPAYLRRGMSVEDAETRVVKTCEAARDEMLYPVKLRLRFWNRLLRDRPRVRKATTSDAMEYAADLGRRVFGLKESTISIAPAGWSMFAGRQWRALGAAVEEFNANWRRYLETLPLDDLHRTIDGYNRYYVLEKECAVRSIRTAIRGFIPKEKPTWADFLARFPPLPTPPRNYRCATETSRRDL